MPHWVGALAPTKYAGLPLLVDSHRDDCDAEETMASMAGRNVAGSGIDLMAPEGVYPDAGASCR